MKQQTNSTNSTNPAAKAAPVKKAAPAAEKALDVCRFPEGVRAEVLAFFRSEVVGAAVESVGAAAVKAAKTAFTNYCNAEAAGFDAAALLGARDAFAAAVRDAEERREALRKSVPDFNYSAADAELWEAVKGKQDAERVKAAVLKWEAHFLPAGKPSALKGTRVLSVFAGRAAFGGYVLPSRKALAKVAVKGRAARSGDMVKDTAPVMREDGSEFLRLFFFSLCDECVRRGVGAFAGKDLPEDVRAAVKADADARSVEAEARKREKREKRAALCAAFEAAEVNAANARAAVERLTKAAMDAHARKDRAAETVKNNGGAEAPETMRAAAEKAEKAAKKANKDRDAARAAAVTAEAVLKRARSDFEAFAGMDAERARKAVANDRQKGNVK